MRIRNRCLFVALVALLAVLPTAVLAGGGGDKERQYDIEGAWYAINSYGNYMVYTIVRTGPDEYTSTMSFLASANPFNFGTTRMTSYVTAIRKVHKNTYDVTSIAYYGDDNNITPMYFGVSYATITSGTIVQTDPDTLRVTFYGKVSCNPCWPLAAAVCGTQAVCQLEEPWDPFDDPDAVCGGPQFNPGHNIAHRVPIDPPCTPGS